MKTVGSDMPRIDYSDDSEGALLLEPQRTNLLLQSSDFSGWFKSGAITITSNYGVSPTGENNSTLLSFSGANNRLYLNTGAAYNNDSVSIYVKGNNGETISFDKSASIGSAKLFTLTGGWDRLESSYNSLSSSRVNIVISTNGGATATNIEVFGIQNEEGSYPTSYIPTQGSTVTRLADVCNNGANEQVINSSEGVLYAEIAGLANDGTNRRITISDGAGSNDVGFRFNNVSNQIQVVSYINSTVVVNQTYVLPDITVIKKYALKWALNNYALWVDGVEVITNNSAISFPQGTLNTLDFASGTNTNNFYGKAKALAVYNTALTDAQLQALTTNNYTYNT